MPKLCAIVQQWNAGNVQWGLFKFIFKRGKLWSVQVIYYVCFLFENPLYKEGHWWWSHVAYMWTKARKNTDYGSTLTYHAHCMHRVTNWIQIWRALIYLIPGNRPKSCKFTWKVMKLHLKVFLKDIFKQTRKFPFLLLKEIFIKEKRITAPRKS